MACFLTIKENFLKHLADFGSTIEYYRLNIAAYLLALFGQKELPDELTPTQILNFEQHIKPVVFSSSTSILNFDSILLNSFLVIFPSRCC